MRIFEFEGLTEQQAWRTRRAWCLDELTPVPFSEMNHTGAALSPSDIAQVELFMGYLRAKDKAKLAEKK